MSREKENMAGESSEIPTTPEGADTQTTSSSTISTQESQREHVPVKRPEGWKPSRGSLRQAIRELTGAVRGIRKQPETQVKTDLDQPSGPPSAERRTSVPGGLFGPVPEEEIRNPTLPDVLKSSVPFRRDLKKENEYASDEDREQAEIEWLKGLMSKIESSGQTHEQFFTQLENYRLRSTLTTLCEGARRYYDARRAFSKAIGFISINIGGNVESFVKYDETIGPMSNEGAMMKQKEVARAFAQLEARAKRIQYKQITVTNPDGSPQIKDGQEVKKWILDKSINPAFADEKQLDDIRKDIAKGLAIESLSEKDIKRDEEEFKDTYDRILKDEEEVMYSSVLHAEVLWRTWMRSGLWNGIVFKVDEQTGQQVLTSDERERLFFAKVTDYESNWDKYKENINWSDSFDSPTTEYTVKGLLWNGLFHHKHRQGREIMRPYVYYGSQDFLSSYLSDSFIKNNDNFLDKRGFVELQDQDLDAEDKKLGKRIFVKGIKTDQSGKVVKNDRGDLVLETDSSGNSLKLERLILHSNGVAEIDSDNPVDLSQVDWTITGEDAYSGVFKRYRLSVAGDMRSKEMGDGKVGNSPFMDPFKEAVAGIGNLDPISRDREGITRAHPDWNKNKIDEEIEKRRKQGKIYRDDAATMLLRGVLNYQTTEYGSEFHTNNINRSQIRNMMDLVRGSAILPDEKVKELENDYLGILHLPNHKRTEAFINTTVNVAAALYDEADPAGAFLAMFLKFLSLSFNLK